MPNTYGALLKSIIEATAFAHKAENRKQIAEAIAPANYLNQPQIVLEQILTGTFADGLGNIVTQPNRVDFDPFPWQSFAIWIMTQMKRWGQIKGDIDYAGIASQVYLATDATRLMKEAGLTPPTDHDQEFFGDGQDLRSGQARGISQQLQDQEGVVRAGAQLHLPLSSRRTPGPIRRVALSFRHDVRGLPSLLTPRSMGPRVRAGRRAERAIANDLLPSLPRGRRLARAVRRLPRHLASRHARHRRRRQHDAGIRQADGTDRDRRASRRCRVRSMSAPSCGSTSGSRSTTTGRTTRASASSSAIRSRASASAISSRCWSRSRSAS